MKRLLCLFLAVLFGFVIGMLTDDGVRDAQEQPVIVRTDTIVKIDTTVVRTQPIRDSVVVRYVTRYLAVHTENNKDATETNAERVLTSDKDNALTSDEDAEDEHCTQKVCVDLPIVQNIYENEKYTAWVSGYDARLDSIRLYEKSVLIDTEKTVKQKQKRWGCVAGVGLGAGTKGLTPMIGITVGYRLF